MAVRAPASEGAAAGDSTGAGVEVVEASTALGEASSCTEVAAACEVSPPGAGVTEGLARALATPSVNAGSVGAGVCVARTPPSPVVPRTASAATAPFSDGVTSACAPATAPPLALAPSAPPRESSMCTAFSLSCELNLRGGVAVVAVGLIPSAAFPCRMKTDVCI